MHLSLINTYKRPVKIHSSALLTMNSAFVILLAFLATSAFAQDPSCEECLKYVAKMGEYLLTEAQVAKIEALIKAEVCPMVGPDNQAGCEAAIDTWWAKIGEAIAIYPNTYPAICGGLGLCSKRTFVKLVMVFRQTEIIW